MDDSSLTNTPIDDGESQTKIIRIVIVIALLAGCCIALIAALAWFQPDPVELIGKYFPSSTATASRIPTITPTRTPTPTSTSTPTPNMTATQKVLDVTSTVEAIQATVTQMAGKWKVVISDTFDSNKNKWLVKTTDDEYAKTIYSIKDGKYKWDVAAHKPFIGWIKVSTKPVSDFYFTAQIQQTSISSSGDYGLVFREDDKGQLYYFGINNDNQYTLQRFYNDEWSELIGWEFSSAIEPDKPNQLTVIAEGDRFRLLINGQFIVEAQDDKIAKGTNAIAIELSQEDDQGTFEFDNVELRRP